MLALTGLIVDQDKVWFQANSACDPFLPLHERSSIKRVTVDGVVMDFSWLKGKDGATLCVMTYTGVSAHPEAAVAVRAAAGFNFDGCGGGSGQFTVTMDQANVVRQLGVIPKGKQGVYVSLVATHDLDLHLYDQGRTSEHAEGRAVVAWCSGDCNAGLLDAATLQSAPYRDMNVTYSGFDGDGLNKGNEFVSLSGTSPDDIAINLFAFQVGTATVNYSWTNTNTPCCAGLAACGGSFAAPIPQDDIIDIGTIPEGKFNLRIQLEAEKDLDIQLYDLNNTALFDEGLAVIAYCAPEDMTCNKGLMGNEFSEEIITYRGLEYTYSGWGGDGELYGNEYVSIQGVTNTWLSMKVYGFEQGVAELSYSYWEIPSDSHGCRGGNEWDPLSQTCVAVSCKASPCGPSEVCESAEITCFRAPCPQFRCNAVAPGCNDLEGWSDAEENTCLGTFTSEQVCKANGANAKPGGRSALQACCMCGGGVARPITPAQDPFDFLNIDLTT